MNNARGAAIAVFGGTFDPIHYGHLRAALEAKEALGVDDFRFMPAGVPPHRKDAVSAAEHRLAMLRRALPEGCGFRIDEREMCREGPSYMADTLTSLRDEVGSAPLLLLIGQDAANGLNQWHRWRDLFSLAHIVILSRAGDVQRHSRPLSSLIRSQIAAHPQSLLEVPGGRVLRIQVTSLAISSSRIRRLIGDGRSPRFLLPPAVLEYIEEHGLYGAPRQKPK